MLPYNSKCENHQGIALPEKFSHYLKEIIQNFYYILFKKMGMLQAQPGWFPLINRKQGILVNNVRLGY